MKRIKKFNELFDSSQLRDKKDATNLKNITDEIGGDFKKEDINTLLTKLARYNFPFLSAFGSRKPKNMGIKLSTEYDPDMKRWNFTIENSKIKIILGLTVNSPNNYDIFVDIEDVLDMRVIRNFAKYDLDYKGLVSIMAQQYLSAIDKFGFEELVGHDYAGWFGQHN